MKTTQSPLSLIFFLLALLPFSGYTQGSTDKTSDEIKQTLRLFNTAAQQANTEGIMKMFDATANIMFIGSDSAEIWKGEARIREHLNSIFPQERVSLDMKRVDIDSNGQTAWAFVDGQIIITTDKGEEFKAPYRFTIILVKKGKDWKIRLFDGSAPGGK